MSNILWHLYRGIHHPKTAPRASYFRNKSWLIKPLGSLKVFPFIKTAGDLRLLESLASFGPLEASDFLSPRDQQIIRQWNRRFPRDPRFYRMAFYYYKIWKSFSKISILDFLKSEDAHKWARKRKQLLRAPIFELDSHFKKSKSSALHYEMGARSIMRKYPALPLIFYQKSGLKNAQPIWNRFPQRKIHEALFTENFLKPMIDELNQSRQKAPKTKGLA